MYFPICLTFSKTARNFDAQIGAITPSIQKEQLN